MPIHQKDAPERPLTSADEAQKTTLHEWWGAIGGGILLVLGVIFAWGGVKLGLGSPFRLGTGAFPFLTGVILAVIAAAIIVQDIRDEGPAKNPDWMAFLAISASLAVFASSAGRLGLVPATFLTTVVASLPDKSLPLVGKVILGAFVAVSAWLLFIQALDLPFKAFVRF